MLSGLSVFGLVLSLVGAVLDFVSGYMILQAAGMFMAGEMGMMWIGFQPVLWGLLLFVLGVLLLITGLLGVTRFGIVRMRIFGGLMVVYGVVMLFVGFSMFMGLTLMTVGASLSGVAMLVVGLGMVVNGLLMIRRPMVM